MFVRKNRAVLSSGVEKARIPHLSLSTFIVFLETILQTFARPILIGLFFIGCAWWGVFGILSPWIHLIILAFFVAYFSGFLGRSHSLWRERAGKVSLYARRRLEEANHLLHRPLDVIEDHSVNEGALQYALWGSHVERTLRKLQKLKMPFWKLSWDNGASHRVRYIVIVLLVSGMISGWGALGGRVLTAINPALNKWHLAMPALDAWITPPEYTHLAPIMIATPAGLRHDQGVIDVPEGSMISAHLAEKEGQTPELFVNNQAISFSAEDNKDYSVSSPVVDGQTLTIRRGWQTLGTWRINVLADRTPQVAFADKPSVTERKSLRLPIDAQDDYGVTSLSLRVSLRQSVPGLDNSPIEINLGAPDAREVKRISFVDLTSHPWAGLPVELQLVATDFVGHKAVSFGADMVLPEKVFTHPLAAALVEERKKLLQNLEDESVRSEAANIMAGIARQPGNYHNDPLILLALRGGAVRLVLDHESQAVASVADLMWQAAVRIEEGNVGTTEQQLRQVQNDLEDALDSNASEADIQKILSRLHQVLSNYMNELSSHVASDRGASEDMDFLQGLKTNALTPQDMDHMLERMKNLSASGDREAVRQELANMQALLENLRTGPWQLTPSQKEALQNLRRLRAIVEEQRQLADRTFQNIEKGDRHENRNLAKAQHSLMARLKELVTDQSATGRKSLTHGADAMEQAGANLEDDAGRQAVEHQGQALKDIQAAEKSMQQDLQQSLSILEPTGEAVTKDPLGRDNNGLVRDDGSVQIPDQMQARHVRDILNELQKRAGETNRPKAERDYIDRLLQNF